VPGNGFLDEVVGAFDEAFDTACGSNGVSSQENLGAGRVHGDEAAVRALFAQIAANYARPITNFIFELKRGTATRDCIKTLQPTLRTISAATENIDLPRAVARITDFEEALSRAQASRERSLGGEMRELILASYQELTDVLPQAFQTGQDEQKREDVIIKSLLRQVPGLGHVTVEKLYRAGLGSLEMLFLANTEDLATVTAIPLGLCKRICDKFQQYHAEVAEISHDSGQSGYRARLASLVGELHSQQEEFERAGRDVAVTAQRRQRRQQREHCLLQILVMLAELGELELINLIPKLSFRRRIQRLEAFLATSTG
jgi:hypothetical protein